MVGGWSDGGIIVKVMARGVERWKDEILHQEG